MEFIIKISQFLLSLSLLIVLHELGHFIPVFKPHASSSVLHTAVADAIVIIRALSGVISGFNMNEHHIPLLLSDSKERPSLPRPAS